MFYRHKNKSHIVKLLDTPLEHTRNTYAEMEEADGLLKYTYCQRQTYFEGMTLQGSGYVTDTNFKPFIIEWELFNELYEIINTKEH